jgi:hypothetical protein
MLATGNGFLTQRMKGYMKTEGSTGGTMIESPSKPDAWYLFKEERHLNPKSYMRHMLLNQGNGGYAVVMELWQRRFQSSNPGVENTLSLAERNRDLPGASQWSVKNFTSSDNGVSLDKAISDGIAVAICDGSSKEKKELSAWVLEATVAGRISGFNFPPGLSTEQNSYRSKLAGLYGIITMVSTVCSLCQLTAGKFTIACDNISALNKRVQYKPPKISEAEHDFLYTIWKVIAALPISYELHHVKGHQDEAQPTEELDQWSLLNIEMDTVAKTVLNSWSEDLDNQQIEGKPWAVWSNNAKLINNLDSRLYEIFNSKQIEEYWIRKNKFPQHKASDIHWEALERVIKTVPLVRRLFITKHAAGMCGVGKFMRLWGERDTDACPRCAVPKNVSHVWRCPWEQAAEVWSLSLQKLHEWMTKVGTQPEMRDSYS